MSDGMFRMIIAMWTIIIIVVVIGAWELLKFLSNHIDLTLKWVN